MKDIVYKNRKKVPLPTDRKCIVEILKNEIDGMYIYVCEWSPYNLNDYKPYNQPGDGYLGTARVIEGTYKGIGFHAWEQNDSEFVWYKILAVESNNGTGNKMGNKMNKKTESLLEFLVNAKEISVVSVTLDENVRIAADDRSLVISREIYSLARILREMIDMTKAGEEIHEYIDYSDLVSVIVAYGLISQGKLLTVNGSNY